MSQYATLTEFANLGPPSAALATLSSDVKTAHLVAASSVADDYIQKRWSTPLTSWPMSLTLAVVRIATFTILAARGFNPANPADAAVIKAHDDAIAWLEKVAGGLLEPAFIDATPAVDEASPLLESEDRQAWLTPNVSESLDFDTPGVS